LQVIFRLMEPVEVSSHFFTILISALHFKFDGLATTRNLLQTGASTGSARTEYQYVKTAPFVLSLSKDSCCESIKFETAKD